MDATIGPRTHDDGEGSAPGGAPAATADVTEDADLLWDRFVPEQEGDHHADELDAPGYLELEDADSVATDLELRWDVFEADARDAEDDAKSARFEAVLDRMAEQAQRDAEGDAGTDLDDGLGGAPSDGTDPGDAADEPLLNEVLEDLEVLEEDQTAPGQEDDDLDTMLARLEEVMYGDAAGDDRPSDDESDESFDWLRVDDDHLVAAHEPSAADSDAELHDALRSETASETDEAVPVDPLFDEPDSWLYEADDVDEAQDLDEAEEHRAAVPAQPEKHGDPEEAEPHDDAPPPLAPIPLAAIGVTPTDAHDARPAASDALGADAPVTDPVLGSTLPGEEEGLEAPAKRRRHARAETTSERRLVLLALLFFLVVLAAVVLHYGRGQSGGSSPVTPSAPSGASPAQLARLESALTDVQSASSGAQAELTTLTLFPTPPRVATVINPYADSLHLYDTLAATVTVPARAREAARATQAEVHSDMAFLGTVNGLPSIQLGAFITTFLARSAELQQSMDTLQHALTTSAP